MPEVAHIGTVTDSQCRVTIIKADNGRITIDGYPDSRFTIDDANRYCNHLIQAMAKAIRQRAEQARDNAQDAEPELGGATSAWEHHYG
jgi:hypothetical protein